MIKQPICIIDDDEDVRAVLGFALEFEGMPSIHFDGALKALDYLKRLSPNELPSLIIVDYQMPDMTGLDFIHHIRKNFPTTVGALPLALSTARITENEEDLPEGVILLPKPLDLSLLIKVSKEHFHSSKPLCSSF